MTAPRPGSVRVFLLVFLLVPACDVFGPRSAGPPAAMVPVVEWTRYDDLLRYVPAGMEGILVFDLMRKDWPKKILDHYGAKIRRGVIAGRKFMFPSAAGIGEFEGIVLLEGAQTIETTISEGSQFVFSYATVDVRRTREAQPRYFARLTAQRTLYATTEAMMRAALKRPGPGGRELATRMGWPDGVAWNSSLVLLRKPDPTIPDEPTEANRRAALWLTTDCAALEGEERAPRFRVTHMTMHAVNPSQLEFAARVKLRDAVAPDPLPRSPTLWETWGGPSFERMEARMEDGLVVMTGNPRRLFAREHPSIAFLMALTMVGVRVFI